MTPEDIEEMRKDTRKAMGFVRVPPTLMLEILDLADDAIRLRSSPDPVIRDPDDDDWDAFQGTKAEFLRIWNRALSRSPAPVVGGVPELADSEADTILGQRDEWEERATDLDALRSEVARLRAQLAALQSVPQGVDVPDLVYLHEEWSLVRGVGGDPEWDAAVFGAGYNLAKSRARLVPTPPQADAVVALTDDMIRREWCNLHSGVEGDPDESAYSAFEEGVRQGFSLRAQPTNNETRG